MREPECKASSSAYISVACRGNMTLMESDEEIPVCIERRLHRP